MTVLRSLDPPETIETQQGIKRATHEVYCYAITPFLNPPIKILVYKDSMDASGHFQVLVSTQITIEFSQEKFKELLNPTLKGIRPMTFSFRTSSGFSERGVRAIQGNPSRHVHTRS